MTDYKNLIEKAYSVMKNSHSPYSKFKVGACVLTKSGKIYIGTNIENASFGATICAERVAINNAVANGEKDFVCLAIVSSSNNYTFPCGICRQTMIEFSNNMEIVVAKNINEFKVFNIKDLLPYYFSTKDIK